MHLEIESDRDVLVDGIGLLSAGKPVVITNEMKADFKLRNGVELVGANFPPYVSVTASFEDIPEGGE